MKTKPRQSGLTLTEMMVVIAAVAMLTSFSMPAVRTFFKSMATSGGTRAVISAALSSARAIAAREQRYAGIRFQQDLDGNQYIIFIVHDFGKTELANGFRAVEGLKPIKLPENLGAMDLKLGTNGDVNISLNTDISNNWQLTDTTTFSIVFSPSGKMVIHDVRVRNRDGQVDSNNNVAGISNDDIFNKKVRVDAEFAMFYQDDYDSLGLGQEASRNSFVIYDKIQFAKIATNRRWFGYLSGLDIIYINPYTGTIIER